MTDPWSNCMSLTWVISLLYSHKIHNPGSSTRIFRKSAWFLCLGHTYVHTYTHITWLWNRKIRIHTSIVCFPSLDFINFCGESKCRMKSWQNNTQCCRSDKRTHIHIYLHIYIHTCIPRMPSCTARILTSQPYVHACMPTTDIHTACLLAQQHAALLVKFTRSNAHTRTRTQSPRLHNRMYSYNVERFWKTQTHTNTKCQLGK
jgi:hypothetical protein